MTSSKKILLVLLFLIVLSSFVIAEPVKIVNEDGSYLLSEEKTSDGLVEKIYSYFSSDEKLITKKVDTFKEGSLQSSSEEEYNNENLIKGSYIYYKENGVEERKKIEEFEYNSNNQKSKKTISNYENNFFTFKTQNLYEYDSTGNKNREIFSVFSSDGKLNLLRYINNDETTIKEVKFEYKEDGTIKETTEESDKIIERTYSNEEELQNSYSSMWDTWEFNTNSNQQPTSFLTKIIKNDLNNDGKDDTTTISYSKNNNEDYIKEIDYNSDGVMDYKEFVFYDTNTEMTSVLIDYKKTTPSTDGKIESESAEEIIKDINAAPNGVDNIWDQKYFYKTIKDESGNEVTKYYNYKYEKDKFIDDELIEITSNTDGTIPLENTWRNNYYEPDTFRDYYGGEIEYLTEDPTANKITLTKTNDEDDPTQEGGELSGEENIKTGEVPTGSPGDALVYTGETIPGLNSGSSTKLTDTKLKFFSPSTSIDDMKTNLKEAFICLIQKRDIKCFFDKMLSSVALLGIFMIIYVIARYASEITLFKAPEHKRFAHIFGIAFGILGVFTSPISNFLKFLLGDIFLSLLFIALIIFTIWNLSKVSFSGLGSVTSKKNYVDSSASRNEADKERAALEKVLKQKVNELGN
ncbi:MAG: hypothetical protein AB7V77_01730 [Candidatus Woesearchaeota archaeon]